MFREADCVVLRLDGWTVLDLGDARTVSSDFCDWTDRRYRFQGDLVVLVTGRCSSMGCLQID